MLSKLLIEINNFGPISHSVMDMNQINIIAGVNSSGKSASSKLLYSFLTSISPAGRCLAKKSINERLFPLMILLRNRFGQDSTEYLRLSSLINRIEERDSKDTFINFLDIYKDNGFMDFSSEIERIEDIIEIDESEDRYAYIMNAILKSEFNPINANDSRIRFCGNSFEYELYMAENGLKTNINEGSLDSLIFDKVIYLDSPFILDSHCGPYSPFHVQDLLNELKSTDSLDIYGDEFSKGSESLKDDLMDLIGGKLEFDSGIDEFVYESKGIRYSMTATASGIKQIGILQMLLDKGIAEGNCFLFIDEPETNLHPDWQIKFAEYMVLLARDSNICLYINSHSPFFIEAIEAYSRFYGILDKVSFFFSSKADDGFVIERIDAEDLDLVYNDLGDPFNRLKSIKEHV